MTIPKCIATYARVSTSNQEDQKTIESQLLAIKDFAQKNNFTIVKEYRDEGWSGDRIDRPGLDQLRVDAKLQLWDAVLIYDPDRLARRYSYQELIIDEITECGLSVLFVTTPPPKDGIDKILHGFQGLFAEYERAKITERFRLGKIRHAKEGTIMQSRSAYGYFLIPKKGKSGDVNFEPTHYEINSEEAQIVKNIFHWIGNEGLSIYKVILKLRELNVRPRFSKKEIWDKTTISRMIKNKTYIGEAHFGATSRIPPIKPQKVVGYKKVKSQVKK